MKPKTATKSTAAAKAKAAKGATNSRRWRMTPRPDALAYPIRDGFEVLGVTYDRGYELMAHGLLKTYKHHRCRFVSRAAIEECIRELEKRAAR